MNPISDTESEPDQNEPIVETLEKTKPKRKYTKKSKSVAPDGDSVPSVVKGNAIKEDAPLPEKPKRTRKAKASKDVAPTEEDVGDNPLPEPEPVKQKREPTQKQKEALEKAREKRRQQREELKAEIKEELKNEATPKVVKEKTPKVVKEKTPKVVKEKTPKVVAFRPSQVDFV